MSYEVREPSAKYLARPAYKQTEVGVIPEDWEVRTLADLAQIRTGIAKNTNAALSDPIELPYLRVANVQDGYLDLCEVSTIRIERNDLRRFAVLPNDVLMNEGGDLDKLGRGALWQGQIQPCVHQNHVFVVRCKDGLLPEFLNAWTSSPAARRYFLLAGRQTTNLASINKTSLGQLPVPVPIRTVEQQVIAAALSDADALIESLEQLLAKKRQIKQGAMQELLTGQRRLPGFAGEWEEKRLGDSAVLKARIGWQGLTTAEYKKTGDVYLVTGTEFNNGYIDWSNCFFVDESRYRQDKNIQLRLHDVLITKDGTIGKAALIDQLPSPATLNSGVFVIRPIDDAFHPEFFYYLLCSEFFTTFLAQLSAGSTINHLYQKDFVGFVFRLPTCIAEQTAIAALLSDMDAELAALEAKLAKARGLKQGMMQELLTGRIRLVQPNAEAIPFPVQASAQPEISKPHNWQINEAVVISVLTKHFGSEQWPLGRKRYTKLSYLLHRHVERQAEGYLKKAAGPYNPATKYKGPEGIALKNGYIRQHARDQFSGFVAAEKIGEAEDYFLKWYGEDALVWLKQFGRERNDELELLATVDMAAEDLRRSGNAVSLTAVKQIIQSHPEWQAKLERPIFSDANIERAIAKCHRLFGT